MRHVGTNSVRCDSAVTASTLACPPAAASPMPAATFAAAANPMLRGDITALRDVAFSATWRNTYRCAAEITFQVFLPWRNDPRAIAIVKPWL